MSGKRIFLRSASTDVRILVRKDYPELRRLEPDDELEPDDVLLLDTGKGRRGKEPPVDELLRSMVPDKARRARIFLLTNQAIDLELCRKLRDDDDPLRIEDYLPHAFTLLPDPPDLRAEEFLGALDGKAEGRATTAHLLEMSWRKLRAYLDYRGGRRAGAPAEGLGANVIGNILEDFVFYFLGMVEGFHCVKGRPSALGQIDVLVRNESISPFWQHAGMFFAVECKNRIGSTGGEVVDKLVSFARRRSGTVRLVMLFHTADRLTVPAQSHLLAEGLGTVTFIDFNRRFLRGLMDEASFDDLDELSTLAENRLKEALAHYVLGNDFARR